MSGQVNYLVEAPELGQEYFYLYIARKPFCVLNKWGGKDLEKRWLALHRVYPTKEDVVERAIEFVKNFYISHKEQLNYLTSEPEAGTEVWCSMNMDGSPLDIASANFDPRTILHPYFLNDFRLYGTREDLIKDIDLITEALEEEYKKAH
ncbi:hypothetical protein [Snodgrassella alvi]|uniref:hypothetical protein n=1 Tax=Snodgrassella alvi TaxID=1196083 RepID=UPI000A01D364|nr:hypothetical protein [Snodgrassella alvi]ORF28240.1 hypothetical protein BGI08_05925 [Snodgrassella alvi]